MAENSPLAIGALLHDVEAIRSIHREALDSLWRVRHPAKKILLGEEIQKQRATLTTEAWSSRLENSDVEPDDPTEPTVDNETGLFIQDKVADDGEEEDLEEQVTSADDEKLVDCVQDTTKSPLDGEVEVPFEKSSHGIDGYPT
ncbi:uncharacterized protein PG998_001958 [Apiospora kogelbergensis]